MPPTAISNERLNVAAGGRFVIAGFGLTERGNGRTGGTLRAAVPVTTGKRESLQIQQVPSTQLIWEPLHAICGPMLALGLFMRPTAVPIVLLLFMLDFERWSVGKHFWNLLGLEYAMMWTVAAFYFAVNGGGAYSRDHLLFSHEL